MTACGPGLDWAQARFTDRAKCVIRQAAVICNEKRHEKLCLDHLWLGLFATDKGVGLTTLERCGMDLERLRQSIAEALPAAKDDRPGYRCATWTSACLSVVALALKRSEEATDSYLSGYVGTEHIVWALLESESIGTQYVREQGLDEGRYINELIAFLHSAVK